MMHILSSRLENFSLICFYLAFASIGAGIWHLVKAINDLVDEGELLGGMLVHLGVRAWVYFFK